MVDQMGILTHPWQKWFQQIYTALGQASGVVSNVSGVLATTLFNAFVSAVPTTYYTVPTGKTLVVSSFTAQNGGPLSATISIWLVPANSTAGSGNLIVNAQSVSAGQTLALTALANQVLTSGGTIVIQSGNSNMYVSATGRVSK
jgi:hypothetical protein